MPRFNVLYHDRHQQITDWHKVKGGIPKFLLLVSGPRHPSDSKAYLIYCYVKRKRKGICNQVTFSILGTDPVASVQSCALQPRRGWKSPLNLPSTT